MSPFYRLRARSLIVQSLLLVIVLFAVAGLVPGLKHLIRTDAGAMLALYAALATVLVLRGRHAGLDWRRLFGTIQLGRTWSLVMVAIPLVALSFAGFWLLFVPLSYVAPDIVRRWALDNPALRPPSTLGAWASTGAVAVLVAPLLEELFFRGILLQRWAHRWGTGRAVLATSALFAVGHVELIGHFIFGLVMAALYLRSRSLWLPIATHAANNLFAVVMSLPGVLHPGKEHRYSLPEFRADWHFGLLAAIVGLAGLALYVRHYWGEERVEAVLTGPVPYSA